MVRADASVEITGDLVRIRMGLLGRADVPVRSVERLSRMTWPWWGGIGVRLGRRLVAYTTAWGDAAVMELDHPIAVRAPLKWHTPRIVVGVEDVDGFLRAVAHARARADVERGEAPSR